MINNRQTGRRRGRGGQGGQGQGGQGHGQRSNNGRAPEMGNRIDNRTRGNAAQLLEKYKMLARDAQQAGDRVLAEYYFQFSDHYFRVLAETRARFEENRRPQGDYAEDGGFEEGDESDDEDSDGAPQQQQRVERPQQREERPRENRPRDERPREDRPREDRPREDRPREDRLPQREEASAPEERRPREDRPRRDYSDGADRQLRPSYNGSGGGNGNIAPSDEPPEPATLEIDRLPPAFGVVAADPVLTTPDPVPEDAPPLPRKRGRPRKDASTVPVEG